MLLIIVVVCMYVNLALMIRAGCHVDQLLFRVTHKYPTPSFPTRVAWKVRLYAHTLNFVDMKMSSNLASTLKYTPTIQSKWRKRMPTVKRRARQLETGFLLFWAPLTPERPSPLTVRSDCTVFNIMLVEEALYWQDWSWVLHRNIFSQKSNRRCYSDEFLGTWES